MNLKEVAQNALVALAERTHEAASLTVLDRFEVVYVAHVPSDQRVQHGRSVGSRLPAHATSTGMVLMAHASPAHRERLLAMPELPAFTSRTPVTTEELTTRFAAAPRDDFLVACDTIEYGDRHRGAGTRHQGPRGRSGELRDQDQRGQRGEPRGFAAHPSAQAAAQIGAMLERYPALGRDPVPAY